jgi:hypothetical protein
VRAASDHRGCAMAAATCSSSRRRPTLIAAISLSSLSLTHSTTSLCVCVCVCVFSLVKWLQRRAIFQKLACTLPLSLWKVLDASKCKPSSTRGSDSDSIPDSSRAEPSGARAHGQKQGGRRRRRRKTCRSQGQAEA